MQLIAALFALESQLCQHNIRASSLAQEAGELVEQLIEIREGLITILSHLHGEVEKMAIMRDAARARLEWKPTREWCEAFEKEHGLTIQVDATCKDVLFLRMHQIAEEGNVEAQHMAEKHGIPYQVSP